jgi:transcriptional regulator with XRE-family HTH domain
VRWARKQKGMEVGYLAELVGIGKAALQNIEYGSTRTGPVTIARLEKMLGVSLQGLQQRRMKLTGELSEQHKPGHGAGIHRGGRRAASDQPRQKQELCSTCFNLAHRRPRVGRCWCGGRFAEDVVRLEIPEARSSAGLCEGAA